MKYHIKLTDNSTGEILQDSDVLCIIGAIGTAEGVSKAVLASGATNEQLALTAIFANEAIEELVKGSDNPVMMEGLIKMIMKVRADYLEQ